MALNYQHRHGGWERAIREDERAQVTDAVLANIRAEMAEVRLSALRAGVEEIAGRLKREGYPAPILAAEDLLALLPDTSKLS